MSAILSLPRMQLCARILFWIALAFTLFMALDPHPPRIVPASVIDKVQHMAAFACLTLLASIGYPRIRLVPLGEHMSFLGALVEVLQSIPALHRDCDIWDWVADTIAITIMLLLIKMVGKTVPRGS